MKRTLSIAVVVLLALSQFSVADESQQEKMEKIVALQAALKRGRDALLANKPFEAVKILEEQIAMANGQTAYLELLRDAYRAAIKEMQLKNGNAETLEHYRRQLRTLELSAPATGIPSAVAKAVPEAPKETAPKELPATILADPQPILSPTRMPALDAPKPIDKRQEAAKLFAAKKYAEAAALYSELLCSGNDATEEEKKCYSFCRLYAVKERLLKKSGLENPELLRREIAAAVQLGGSSLKPFGDELLKALPKEAAVSAPSPTSEGVATVSANFRVTTNCTRLKTAEVLKFAEQQRAAAFERWLGSPGTAWKTPCEIRVYESAVEFARATGKSSNALSQATFKWEGGKSMARRIDLHLEAEAPFDSQLPKEIHYLVICELFGEDPLPSWAEFGMTALAEPPSHRSRNRRMMAKLIEDKKAPRLEKVLTSNAPGDASITPYYLTSVTLIEYLVRLKGYRTLMVCLQEAPRRGLEASIANHFNIRTLAELEKKWQADILKGE